MIPYMEVVNLELDNWVLLKIHNMEPGQILPMNWSMTFPLSPEVHNWYNGIASVYEIFLLIQKGAAMRFPLN